MLYVLFCLHTLTLMFLFFIPAGCEFSGEVIAALEINTTANLVYQLNFTDTKLLQKNIEVCAYDLVTSSKCTVGLGTKVYMWVLTLS